ncbi:hypothetical protein KO481_25455 [Nocardia sp. NEAU-G5]|uniref:PE domain-containing protein n=1 Tax=Nocardia albiluteola TaxID=2842303 RepID=A0ABS6B3I2_9NOCA|nr:hypothetical protein [Nocardia albiluteola]MBU3064863.1 hypothetical protein [Nocardia albiluteola]
MSSDNSGGSGASGSGNEALTTFGSGSHVVEVRPDALIADGKKLASLPELVGGIFDTLTSLHNNITALGQPWGDDKTGEQFSQGASGYLAALNSLVGNASTGNDASGAIPVFGQILVNYGETIQTAGQAFASGDDLYAEWILKNYVDESASGDPGKYSGPLSSIPDSGGGGSTGPNNYYYNTGGGGDSGGGGHSGGDPGGGGSDNGAGGLGDGSLGGGTGGSGLGQKDELNGSQPDPSGDTSGTAPTTSDLSPYGGASGAPDPLGAYALGPSGAVPGGPSDPGGEFDSAGVPFGADGPKSYAAGLGKAGGGAAGLSAAEKLDRSPFQGEELASKLGAKGVSARAGGAGAGMPGMPGGLGGATGKGKDDEKNKRRDRRRGISPDVQIESGGDDAPRQPGDPWERSGWTTGGA